MSDMGSSQDHQPTHLIWLVAAAFSHQDYQQAKALIVAGAIQVNRQVVQHPLAVIQSGDTLVWQNNYRAVDLHALRKANVLRRQAEALMGGPEAAYQRLASETKPVEPPA